jgi:hypothetical protein
MLYTLPAKDFRNSFSLVLVSMFLCNWCFFRFFTFFQVFFQEYLVFETKVTKAKAEKLSETGFQTFVLPSFCLRLAFVSFLRRRLAFVTFVWCFWPNEGRFESCIPLIEEVSRLTFVTFVAFIDFFPFPKNVKIFLFFIHLPLVCRCTIGSGRYEPSNSL